VSTWTFNYDPTSQLDRVRILVGDTDENDPLISDEEIGLYLTGGYWAAGSDHLAAASVATAIAAKFARRADSLSAGGTSVNWAGLVDRYRTLAVELAEQGASAAGLSAAPFAGGISVGDVLAREADTDRVSPFFRRDTRPLAPRTTEVYR
jgi:hypothetical protein